MQSSSSPDMRRPREEDSLSLEQVKRGGGLVVSLSSECPPPTAMEVGTPRGNETTIGSCSGLFGATSTLMATDFEEVVLLRLFERAGAGSFVAARVDEDLRFFVGPTRVVAMVAGRLVVGDCVMMFAMVHGLRILDFCGGGCCRLVFPPFLNTTPIYLGKGRSILMWSPSRNYSNSVLTFVQQLIMCTHQKVLNLKYIQLFY